MRPTDPDSHRSWILACIVDAARRTNRATCDLTRDDFGALRPTPSIDWPSSRDFGAHGGWQVMRGAAGGAVGAVPLAAIPARHRVRGVSTLIDAAGNTSQQWIKTAAIAEAPEEALARLFAELPKSVEPRTGSIPPPLTPSRADLMAVIPVGDPHLGLRCWKEDSGADFDLAIAERLMVGAIRDLVLRGPRAAQCLLILLGDTLHYDNVEQHTTKGAHTLDVDGRHAKVARVAMRVITTMIDTALEHHDVVTVDSQAGNHDSMMAMMLAICLDAFYRNEPRVKIILDPASRHYHRFGANLIGTVHGDKTKGDDLGSIMAAEKSRDWGETRHRAWYCGHVHHGSQKDLRGCTVETFRTLAARDSWAAGHGYIAGRDMRRIVLHREYGEIGREIVSVECLEAHSAESA